MRSMPRYLRYLRIGFTAICMIACPLLTALWVRSYWWQDTVSWRCFTPEAIRLDTFPGRFCVETFIDRQETVFFSYSGGGFYQYWGPRYRVSSKQLTEPTAWQMYRGPIGNPLLIPLWLPPLAAAILAALPWLRWRFSLRTLLIAITIIALLLGLIIATTR
jgi:hypothetical protein